MPELRWILIAFGLALLIGIYLWGRRSDRQAVVSDDALLQGRPEPDLQTYRTYETETVDESNEPTLEVESAPVDEVSAETVDVDVAPRGIDPRLRTTVRTYAASPVSRPEDRLQAAESNMKREWSRGPRIEPTFSEDAAAVTEELPVDEQPAAVVAEPANDAPTLGMSTSTPAQRRIERRKIIALRLAAGSQRLPGTQLKAALESESLQHGKYDVFHRLDEQGTSLFSIASMVEPGTFNLEKMPQENFPGVTLFMQLPGPVAGMQAFNELIACSRRLHAALGGTLQDERGVPLTVHRIERLRHEIREFEQRPSADPTRTNPGYSPSP